MMVERLQEKKKEYDLKKKEKKEKNEYDFGIQKRRILALNLPLASHMTMNKQLTFLDPGLQKQVCSTKVKLLV